uniref:Uncharacterized protein n=1 Tax=Anguilla anguilla TaxID=7936 RepID=A0A0E9P8N8_ANGAN
MPICYTMSALNIGFFKTFNAVILQAGHISEEIESSQIFKKFEMRFMF